MHSSADSASASSHTGSGQITISFGCEISEFRFHPKYFWFHPIADVPNLFDRLLVLASTF